MSTAPILWPRALVSASKIGELLLVDDALGTEQGSQRLLPQIRVGGDDLAVAHIDFLSHFAANQSERTGLTPVHQVEEQLGNPSFGQGSGRSRRSSRGGSRREEAQGFCPIRRGACGQPGWYGGGCAAGKRGREWVPARGRPPRGESAQVSWTAVK